MRKGEITKAFKELVTTKGDKTKEALSDAEKMIVVNYIINKSGDNYYYQVYAIKTFLLGWLTINDIKGL